MSPLDVYHEWLGIPPREQPPTAYRLLGLDLFEANPNVIQNAAERQTSYVRSRQLGLHSQAAQGLLNEISAARVMLLDPRRKAEYDASLRVREQPAPPPMAVPQAMPIVAPAAAPPPVAPPKPLGFVPASPAAAISPPLLWGMAAAGVLFAGGAIYLATRPGENPAPAAAHPSPKAEPAPVVTPPAAKPHLEEHEPEPTAPPDKVRPVRPPKKPKRPNKKKGEEIEATDPAPIARAPKSEKELDRGLTHLADSLLDKLTRPPEVAPPATPPKADPPPPIKAAVPAEIAKMSYLAEPKVGGFRVTIFDTPLGTATVLLDGDFPKGATHNLMRRVPADAPPAEQHVIEVDVIDGRVARVAWDKGAIAARP